MKTLLIDGFGDITKEGLVIHFNQKFALNGRLPTDEWYVSWDKIGRALCGEDYCEEIDPTKLRKIRGVNPVDAQVIPKIAEEKLMLNWQEAKLIDGTPAYILDDSHGVSIDNYIDRIEIKFYERVKEGGKYYCRTTKKHVIDAKKVKEDFEALNE